MVRRACVVVNPFAGIGGPLARRGTSRELVLEAVKRGYELVGFRRAAVFARHLARFVRGVGVAFYTASGYMGENALGFLRSIGVSVEVVYRYSVWPTSSSDTIAAVRRCVEAGGVGLIVFVGGDGTARDVLEALRTSSASHIPVLGVPAGVKMFSSIFAVSPRHAARVVGEWARGRASVCEGEVVDYDEDAYRRGVLRLVFHGVVKSLCGEGVVGSTKDVVSGVSGVEENREAIARYVVENMENCTLYVLGPGSTVAWIARVLGVDKTLLGVDVVHNGRLIGVDLDEARLYEIVKRHVERGGRVRIVLSPIGGQGFILGRGNQQISPRIIRLVGRDGLVVVADKYKLRRLKGRLRVDTGDSLLDEELRGYIRVITDYGEEYVAKIE